jgi:hypothetical protein
MSPPLSVGPERDAEARARELASLLIVQHLSTAKYKGADLAATDMALLIRDALQAERDRALEDAWLIADDGNLSPVEVARQIRALKE